MVACTGQCPMSLRVVSLSGHAVLVIVEIIELTHRTTASDPVFWLHHGNVDRTWWSWQTRNISAREVDMSGPLVQFDYGNQKGGNISIDDTIYIGTTVNVTTTIREVMHIQKGILCYTYDEIY